MGVLVVVLLIAALVGGVVWNHKTQQAAQAGINAPFAESPDRVALAISAAFLGGAKAKVKTVMSGVSMRAAGNNRFVFESKWGDAGELTVRPGAGGGSVVEIRTTTLVVGAVRGFKPSKGFMAIGFVLTHAMYKVLGVAQNASKMKRYQSSAVSRISKQLEKSTV